MVWCIGCDHNTKPKKIIRQGDTDTGGTDTGGTDTDISGLRSVVFDNETKTATLGGRQTSTVVTRDIVVTRDGATRSLEVELTAFGRTVTFTENDFDVAEDGGEVLRNTYIKELDDGTEIQLFSLSSFLGETWEWVHVRTGSTIYVVPYLVRLESEDTIDILYNVYGDETSSGDMPTNGSVTYTGRAYGFSGMSSVADNIENYAADVTLTADFQSSVIHGSISPAKYYESETNQEPSG